MSTADPCMLEVVLSYHSMQLGLCFPSCDYGGVVRMETFSALICHVVPGSSGQKASSLRSLYVQGSKLLKCNFRFSWLLKIFNNGLVDFPWSCKVPDFVFTSTK